MDEATLKKIREERLKDLAAIDRVLNMMVGAHAPIPDQEVLTFDIETTASIPEATSAAHPTNGFRSTVIHPPSDRSKVGRTMPFVKNIGKDFTNDSLWQYIVSQDPHTSLKKEDLRVVLWLMKKKNTIIMLSKQSGKRKAVYRFSGGQ